ncbi:xanthine dehydrogenase accessory protein XdhC [Novosphingobium flavum]|uniref:Xanthine dehydrogenase accessory protein XdhC n=1 Tax=Novosphingobium flavum TaxID=1778672 RepID=A0A7X1FQV5_9SPHN|nr:xanthine dehydrogenase accessory protein XdhC [Novosphingobium flavum]MBC2665253.1 xanthine dehydrogenase accessory protein XdhC [Novosphingobium flavum]
MTDWLHILRELAPREPTALVSVLATEGSAPRGPGTRMLVTAHGEYGTIGGGALEFRVIEQARAILAHPPGTWRVQDYPLGPLLGQCCGGRVRVLVEHVDPDRLGWLDEAGEGRLLVSHLHEGQVFRQIEDGPVALPSARGDRPREGARFAELIGRHRRPLYLFGAGHVGQAIARHAPGLPLRLCWFDTRPVFETIEGVAIVPEAAVEDCVAEAPDDSAIVILTHDHALDYRLTKAALSRPPVAFTGLIGSQTKRARFLSRLTSDGVDEAARARLTCPIGLPGITGKEPDVIAVALIAQLLQLDRTG